MSRATQTVEGFKRTCLQVQNRSYPFPRMYYRMENGLLPRRRLRSGSFKNRCCAENKLESGLYLMSWSAELLDGFVEYTAV